jgi:hypothetical protein
MQQIFTQKPIKSLKELGKARSYNGKAYIAKPPTPSSERSTSISKVSS